MAKKQSNISENGAAEQGAKPGMFIPIPTAEITNAAETARIRAEREAKEKADKKAADAVVALIRAIGVVEYTDACLEKINAAKQAYTKLTADQKKLVENADVITTSEKEYDKLKNATKKAEEAARKKAEKEAKDKADKKAADAVVALIRAIGVVEYTDACLKKINAAKQAYTKLTAGQKKLVENADVLTASEDKYNDFQKAEETARKKAAEAARKKAEEAARKKAEAEAKKRAEKAARKKEADDKQAADAVTTRISIIGNVSNDNACFQRITTTRKAFDALSTDQKKLVKNTDILIKAEEQRDKFVKKNEEQMLRVQIGKDSGNRSFLHEYCERVNGRVVIPDGVEKIGYGAFWGTSWHLKEVTIPNSVISIGDKAFYDCDSLTSIIIPDSVTNIGENAFSACRSLTSVTIPYSVTSIGGYAFDRCSNLTSITIFNRDINIDHYAFNYCNNLREIIIPKGTKQQFLQKDGIKDIAGGEYMLIEDESLSHAKSLSKKAKNATNDALNVILKNRKQPDVGVVSHANHINKIFAIGLIVLWAIFLLINAIYTWVANSWLSCIFWVIITFAVFMGILSLVSKSEEEHPINMDSPDAGSIAHLVWRIIWVLGLSIICEIIMMVIFA